MCACKHLFFKSSLSDIFWYRDLAEVEELQNDDQFAITCLNTHIDVDDTKTSEDESEKKAWIKQRSVLEVYNTTADTQGQYLCICVNDDGQCNQAVKLHLIGKERNACT